ncbi:MAG TPA: hypothetical protein PKL53_08080 [Methylotenera sp.]|nr:hypothetical protein [Methylotenera sp.]HPV45806.1 hypothetical protein [Methylotenera sp.]
MTSAAIDYRSTGYRHYNPIADIAIGVSDAAKSISAKIININNAKLRTVTGSQKASMPSKAFEALLEILGEGENISYAAFTEALIFLQNLPANFEIPDIGVEPSGAITFEWYKNPFKVFVISIDGTNSLEFAALAGSGNEMHAKMNYKDKMPIEIKSLLEIFLSA